MALSSLVSSRLQDLLLLGGAGEFLLLGLRLLGLLICKTQIREGSSDNNHSYLTLYVSSVLGLAFRSDLTSRNDLPNEIGVGKLRRHDD